MRALRVLRLFGRFRSLRKILSALALAILPVINSFVIIFIIACICELAVLRCFSPAILQRGYQCLFTRAPVTKSPLCTAQSAMPRPINCRSQSRSNIVPLMLRCVDHHSPPESGRVRKARVLHPRSKQKTSISYDLASACRVLMPAPSPPPFVSQGPW